MKVLIVGINYAPEPTGIAVYTCGLACALAERGHAVRVITAPPHFPGWKVPQGYSAAGYRRETIDGIRVTRCPIYVPTQTGGLKRILHYASFALSSLPPALIAARRFRPDLVLAVAPALLSAPVARLAARVAGARSWLHVQDFEIDAAFATGALGARGRIARLAEAFERRMLRSFDRVSTISPQMRRKLVTKGVAEARTRELRNWAEVDAVRPLGGPSPYRVRWDIAAPHVALYSGSIGNKQGIETIIDAARRLRDRQDIAFVICGQGPNRARLEALAQGLPNLIFKDLQPVARLGELMGLATVHLLPQIEDAADLVLPSKLTNMLASGRPVVATAAPGTGLYDAVAGCGIATPPGNARAFADAITRLADDPEARAAMGRAARAKAEAELSATTIIDAAEREMVALVQEGSAR